MAFNVVYADKDKIKSGITQNIIPKENLNTATIKFNIIVIIITLFSFIFIPLSNYYLVQSLKICLQNKKERTEALSLILHYLIIIIHTHKGYYNNV